MKIEKNKILNVLNQVKPGITTKEILEQSSSFVFKNNRIYTFNDEIMIQYPFEFEFEGAVQAQELYTLLTKSKEKELEFEITENELRIKGKRGRAGIRLDTEISLPIEEVEEPEEWKDLPDDFLEGAKFCYFSAASSMATPALTCLKLHKSSIISCDNLRISKFKFDEECFEENTPILLPASCISILSKYNITKYSTTEEWLHFGNDEGLIFSCRIMEEDYPELNQFLKVKGEPLSLPDELKEVIDKTRIFSIGGLTENEEELQVSIESGKLVLRGEGEKGWYEEKVRIRYKGEKKIFIIHPLHLQQIILHVNQCIVGEHSLKFEGDNFIYVVYLSEDE